MHNFTSILLSWRTFHLHSVKKPFQAGEMQFSACLVWNVGSSFSERKKKNRPKEKKGRRQTVVNADGAIWQIHNIKSVLLVRLACRCWANRTDCWKRQPELSENRMRCKAELEEEPAPTGGPHPGSRAQSDVQNRLLQRGRLRRSICRRVKRLHLRTGWTCVSRITFPGIWSPCGSDSWPNGAWQNHGWCHKWSQWSMVTIPRPGARMLGRSRRMEINNATLTRPD